MRLITLITTSTHPDGIADPEPLSADAMKTAESVQQQVGVTPDQWDLTIVRDVGDFPVVDLHRLSAEAAETEWVSFINEGETLNPECLRHALPMCETSNAHAVGCDGLLFWRRSYYLSGE